MSRITCFLKHTSFSQKIMLTVLLAVIPMVAITMISMRELSSGTEERQLYLIGNNYQQVLSSLEEKINAAHSASTLITVNEQINRTLADAGQMDIRPQLAAFEEVSAYTRIVEMGNSQMSIYFFLDEEYLVVQERSTRYRPIDSFRQSPLGQRLQANQGHPVWGITDENAGLGQPRLALARDLIDQSDYTRTLGVLVIALNEIQVQGVLSSALPGQYMGICTKEGEICISNGAALPAGITLPISNTMGMFANIVQGEMSYLICSSQLDDTGLYLVSVLPKSMVTQEVGNTQRHVLIAYLIIFVAMGILLIPLTGWMVSGIRQIRRQLLDVPAHGLRKLTHSNEEDEIGQLVAAYNGMVDEMQHMLQVQYDMGRAKAGAELKALQSQINPHFLYNTLDMVSWMAKRQETDNIQQVMQALSEFYKLTLSGGRDIITLEEELRLCDAFMSIQKLRWAGTIDYIAEVDDELLPARIPKITLQPLIENAIKHGLMQRGDARGSIIVSAVSDMIDGRPYMTLSVLDSGAGTEVCRQEKEENGGSHYGMKNIEMRLSLFYEETVKIQFDSELDLGTCVTLTVPVIIQEEMEYGET
ncbi:MAG: histidine kinase [Oscillospiraceae bacterium]|nr:histidine kinase [Oscillospiraceae bacterium]